MNNKEDLLGRWMDRLIDLFMFVGIIVVGMTGILFVAEERLRYFVRKMRK